MYCDFQLYNNLFNADIIICIFEFLPFSSSFFLMKLIKMDQIFLYCVESREHNDANYFVFLEDNIFFLSIAISEVFFRREFFYPQLCVLIFFLWPVLLKCKFDYQKHSRLFLKLFDFFFLFCIIYHWLWYFKLRYMVYNKYNLHVLWCFIMTPEDIITFACTILNHTAPRVTHAIGFPV